MNLSSVFISELLPNPLGSDATGEWIELYNQGDQTIFLAGWSLMDASGKKFTFADGHIASGNFFIITRPTTKISLNNDSDTITLFDANGVVVDTFAYSFSSSLAQDVSLARDVHGTIERTNTPTPGAQNSFVAIQKNNNSQSSRSSSTETLSTTASVFSLSDNSTTQVLFSPSIAPTVFGLALFLGVCAGCVAVALFRMFFADFEEIL